MLRPPRFNLLSAFCDSIGTSEYDDTSKALLSILESTGTSLMLLRFMLEKEITETGKLPNRFSANIIIESNAGTLFRGTSMTTKLVSFYCKEKGTNNITIK